MSTLKNVGAAVLGWGTMVVALFISLFVAWAVLGTEGALQPESWSPSSLWIIVMIVMGLVAATLGGAVCAKTAPDRWAVWALVGIVVVLGLAVALPEAPAAPGPRPVDVGMFEAMMNAQPPRWLPWLDPVLGVVGALLGARLVHGRKAL